MSSASKSSAEPTLAIPPDPLLAGNLTLAGNLQTVDAHDPSPTQKPFVAEIRCERALAALARRLCGRAPASTDDLRLLAKHLDPEQMELRKGPSAVRCRCGRVVRGLRRAADGSARLAWLPVCRCGLRTDF